MGMCCVLVLKVTISVTDNNKTWFEGFLIQARPVSGENTTYGVFATNDPQLQGLQCPNSPDPVSNVSIKCSAQLLLVLASESVVNDVSYNSTSNVIYLGLRLTT